MKPIVASRALAFAWAVCLGVSGCTHRAKTRSPAGSGHGVAGVKTEEHSYQPLYPASKRFADSRLGHSCGKARVWASWLRKQGYRVESSLCHVAQDSLRASDLHPNLVSSLSEDLMGWHGRTEVETNYISVEGSGVGADFLRASKPSVKKALARFKRREVALGVALIEDRYTGQSRLLLVQSRARAKLAAFPRHFSPGGWVKIQGELVAGRRDPMLYLVTPSGDIVQRSLGKGRRFRVQIPCDRGAGTYQVELAATGPMGPEIVLNVALLCDTPAPDRLSVRVENIDPELSFRELERASVQLLNDLRARHGLAALQVNRDLTASAREHSREMESMDYVGHRSPRRGDFAQRLRKTKLNTALALENVASGMGPQDVLDRLWASPGHRANMLSPEVTEVGIGVAIRTTLGSRPRHQLFLTQQFVRTAKDEPKR